MIVSRLEADDIEVLLDDAAELEIRAYKDRPRDLTEMVGSPWGWSCRTDKTIAAGGILAAGEHIGFAWGIVGRVAKRDVLPICRVVREKVQASPFGWIEAQVNKDSWAARDFARACGFVAIDAQDHKAAGLRFARMVYRKGIMATAQCSSLQGVGLLPA